MHCQKFLNFIRGIDYLSGLLIEAENKHLIRQCTKVMGIEINTISFDSNHGRVNLERPC